MASLPLDRLQRWMQGVVVHPGSTEEALLAPEVASEAANVDDVILPSKSLTPAERLSIYHGMYLLRMEEALASDYPALKRFLGDDGFLALVQDYVQVYPSRSYTFNRFGDHVPEFLMNARGRAHRAFLADLARVELAVTEVFDAPQEDPLGEEEIAAVAPEDWPRAVLRPVPAFRLLGCRTNVQDYLQAIKQDRRPPRPRARESWLAISRREYAVYRQELPRAAFGLLSDLAVGVAVGPAIQSALARERRGRPQEEQLFRWFRDWVASGIFATVRIVGPEGLEPSTSRL